MTALTVAVKAVPPVMCGSAGFTATLASESSLVSLLCDCGIMFTTLTLIGIGPVSLLKEILAKTGVALPLRGRLLVQEGFDPIKLVSRLHIVWIESGEVLPGRL